MTGITRFFVGTVCVMFCTFSVRGQPLYFGFRSAGVEGTTVTNTVILADRNNPVREYWYRTKSGSALEGVDFAAASGRFIFEAGEYLASITLGSLDDTGLENEEVFHIEISSTAGFEEIVQEFAFTLADNELPWVMDLTLDANVLLEQASAAVEDPFSLLSFVSSIARQADGKILVGGLISSEEGLYRGLLRLEANGEVDSSFQTGTAFGSVRNVAQGADGAIYATAFPEGGGEALVKLDASGKVVWSRSIKPGSWYFTHQPMLLRADGTVLIGGSITNIGGVERKHLALVDGEGNVVESFAVELDKTPTVLAELPGGDVLVGGYFTTINGERRARLARLKRTGELDLSFDAGTLLSAEPTAVAVQPDGKILVSGIFNLGNGGARDRVMRLQADGRLDESFSASLDEPAYSMAIDAEGRIVLGGDFHRVNGVARHRVARLFPDGSLDVSLNPGAGPSSRVRSVLIEPSGSYLVGGSFKKIGMRGAPGVARLLPDSGTKTADFADGENFAVETYGEAHVQLQRYGDSSGELEVEVSIEQVSEPHLAEYKNWSTTVRLAEGVLRMGVKIPFPDDGEVEGSESLVVRCRAVGESRWKTAVLTIIDDEEPVLAERILYTSARAREVKATPSFGHLALGGYVFREGYGLPGVLIAGLDGEVLEFTPPIFGPEGHTWIRATAWTPDKKLVVGGQFGSVNNYARAHLVRLNLDGSVDEGFSSTAGAGVTSLAVQPDGKVIVGRSYPFQSGELTSSIVRVNIDGTLDTSFKTQITGDVAKIILQQDGKILASVGMEELVRLRPDGSTDTEFARLTTKRMVQERSRWVYQPLKDFEEGEDGSILVLGHFAEIDGVLRTGVARLNADGTLDRGYKVRSSPGQEIRLFRGGRVLARQQNEWVLYNSDGSRNRSFFAGQPDYRVGLVALLEGRRFVVGEEVWGNLSYGTRFAIAPEVNKWLTSVRLPGEILTLDEKAGGQEFEIRRIGDVSRAVVVNVSVELVEGEDNSDFVVQTPVVSFGPMQRTQKIVLEARKDEWIEREERFRLRLSSSDSNFVASSREIILRDHDGRPGSSRFSARFSQLDFANAMMQEANGDFFVFRPQGDKVKVFNPQTGVERELSVPGNTNEAIVMVTIGPDGSYYFGRHAAIEGGLYRVRPGEDQAEKLTGVPEGLSPRALVFEPDGKLFVGGYSTLYPLGVNLARLHPDGTLEKSYKLFAPVEGMLRLSETNLLYHSFDEIRGFNPSNGQPTVAFQPIIMRNAYVTKVAKVTGGFLVAGSLPGIPSGLARFDMNGKLDGTFSPKFNQRIRSFTLDERGRILVYGQFDLVNGVVRRRLARLLADGRLDESFDPGASLVTDDFASYVERIAVLESGEISAVVRMYDREGKHVLATIIGDIPLTMQLAGGGAGGSELVMRTMPNASYLIESSGDLVEWRSFWSDRASAYQVQLPLQNSSDFQFFRAAKVGE